MKILSVILIAVSLLLSTVDTKAQLRDLTGASGQTLATATTYSFYDAVSEQGKPFTLHVFSSLSVDDTTAVTIWQSNTSVGNGAWEQLGNSYTLVPSDTSKLITDTLWGRRIKLKIVAGASDTTGKVYGTIYYGTLK